MLNQIIRQQSIILLNKILSNESSTSANETHRNIKYLNEKKYIQSLLKNLFLKADQAKLANILIEGYKSLKISQNKQKDQNQENEVKELQKSEKQQIISQALNEQDMYPIIKQIKRKIQLQYSQLLTFTVTQLQKQTQLQTNDKQKQSVNCKTEQIIPIKSHETTTKKGRKDFQIIKRNIIKIKSYSTANPSSISNLSSNNHYLMDIDNQMGSQICSKIFMMYAPTYPGDKKPSEFLSFQLKEQYKTTLNYHKILQVFTDLGLNNIEIEKKLSILRIIKKHSFNPQFIIEQEWNKIYKNLINLFGFKQIMLIRFIKQKEQQRKKPFSIIKQKQSLSKINTMQNIESKKKTAPPLKQENEKHKHRTRKIKTQTSILTEKYDFTMSQSKMIRAMNTQAQGNKSNINNNKLNIMNSGIRRIDEINNQSISHKKKSYNPNEYRLKHKKLITQPDQFTIKNIKNNLKPLEQKIIGFENQKKTNQFNSLVPIQNEQDSYLNKAIKSKKINKITWQSLFNMTEHSMYHNIVIPAFAKFDPDPMDYLLQI